MKRKCYLTILLWFSALAVHAQAFNVLSPEPPCIPDTVGHAQIDVMYEATFYIDTAHKEKPKQEEMLLEAGRHASKFHSYAKYLCDSVFADDCARKVSQEIVNAHLRQYATYLLTETVCKNYPLGSCTVTDCLGGQSRIRYSEPLEWPQWQLTAASDTIMGYACLGAECSYKGRHWRVLYAPDLSISDGPWKLGGLPGLILRAEDHTGEYCFVAKGIRVCHPSHPILVKSAIHDAVSRKQYDKMHERFWDDPIGFITGSSPNTNMRVTDEHGNSVRPRGIAHNPIER